MMLMMMSKRCFDGNNFNFDKRNNNTCEHIEKVLNEERKESIKVQRHVPRDHGVFQGHYSFKV
jgi:collagenase-like PrtC family protease